MKGNVSAVSMTPTRPLVSKAEALDLSRVHEVATANTHHKDGLGL